MCLGSGPKPLSVGPQVQGSLKTRKKSKLGGFEAFLGKKGTVVSAPLPEISEAE